MDMKALFSGVLVSTLLLIGAPSAPAADTAPSRTAAPDKLSGVRASIAEQKWQAAIDELKAVNDTGSADWNNLMGYTLRKQATPDVAAAERFYAEALRIEPKHRGALEYSGELYLMTGNLPKAEERLAALDRACLFSCEEYRDLKRAVERYKAAGNKYVASP
jgi:tetratricopeptide (TPR) repeat protein